MPNPERWLTFPQASPLLVHRCARCCAMTWGLWWYSYGIIRSAIRCHHSVFMQHGGVGRADLLTPSLETASTSFFATGELLWLVHCTTCGRRGTSCFSYSSEQQLPGWSLENTMMSCHQHVGWPASDHSANINTQQWLCAGMLALTQRC